MGPNGPSNRPALIPIPLYNITPTAPRLLMSTIKRKPPQAVTEAERDEGKVLIEQDGGMDVYMCVCNEHRRKCVNLPTDYPPSRPTDPSPFQTDHAQTVALGAIHRLRHHPPPHPLSLPPPIHNSPPQHTIHDHKRQSLSA